MTQIRFTFKSNTLFLRMEALNIRIYAHLMFFQIVMEMYVQCDKK